MISARSKLKTHRKGLNLKQILINELAYKLYFSKWDVVD